jgi:hypothetical protein
MGMTPGSENVTCLTAYRAVWLRTKIRHCLWELRQFDGSRSRPEMKALEDKLCTLCVQLAKLHESLDAE